jgi:poly-gamma-glutamate capsule biosynthesis protein CapA/YwtB (metallophosphatase superfamily)
MMRSRLFFIIGAAAALITVTYFFSSSLKLEVTSSHIETPEKEEIQYIVKADNTPEALVGGLYEDIRISAVGDILVHEDQLRSQYNAEKNEYDFTNNFRFVKDFIGSADIAIANFETTLGGNERRYTGYPRFNSPDSIGDALKYAGFDIITTANNHILDSGAEGMIRTGQVLRSMGFYVIGTRENKEDKGYIIKEVKGVRIGFANYTFETQRRAGRKTINSLIVPREVEELIDTFNYGSLTEDIGRMELRIEEMRNEGVDLIVFCMHWGDEYKRHPNNNQKRIAQQLSDLGVDIIIGAHPHVIQPINVINSQISGKNTIVIYSLGNFISNQCYERLRMREPEDGIIVNIHIRRNIRTGQVLIDGVSYIPTWVHRQPKENLFVYEIVPLYDALKDKGKFNLITEESIWRAQNSHQSTVTFIDAEAAGVTALPIVQHKSVNIDASR